MITFIKLLKYKTPSENADGFDYAANLGLQKIDPSTEQPRALDAPATIIIHSNMRRVIECVDFRADKKYIPRNELREILFDLRKMCEKGEWEKEKSRAVRREFVNSFIKDTLPIKRAKILEEAKSILSLCYKLSEKKGVSVISHSFRLKVIEAYIGTSGKLESNPSLLGKYIHADKKTFEFGEGFKIDRSVLMDLFVL